MKIDITDDKCAVVDGTFTYLTKEKSEKTVPIIKIFSKYGNIKEYILKQYDYSRLYVYGRCMFLATK